MTTEERIEAAVVQLAGEESMRGLERFSERLERVLGTDEGDLADRLCVAWASCFNHYRSNGISDKDALFLACLDAFQVGRRVGQGEREEADGIQIPDAIPEWMSEEGGK